MLETIPRQQGLRTQDQYRVNASLFIINSWNLKISKLSYCAKNDMPMKISRNICMRFLC